MKGISLYIHIPFCVSKCYYCDFSSFANKNDKIETYIDSLIKELNLYKDKLNDYYIKTIFIGGGTPSSIEPKYIYRILEFINKHYNTSRLNEVTIEANPGTLDKEKVKIYRSGGINRVSMGAQTLDDNLLKTIGRTHKVDDIYDSFELLRNANINNINIDLMFGLPGQNVKDVMDSLKKVIDLKIEHISYYGLILEEGTYLNKLFEIGKVILPNEDEERLMYHKATEYLIQNGYNHYEISNYSLPTYECKHNLVYWDVLPYLGLGLSSHSNLNNKRFWNVSDLDIYIDKLKNNEFPIEGEEFIDFKTEISEFCIMGLRKISGINKIEFKNRFNKEIEELYKDIIEKHVKSGLIKNDFKNISLTQRGLDLSNLVEVDFL